MSVTMETKSKVCVRSKVHVSSKSLIQCVAKSAPAKCNDFLEEPSDLKPSTFLMCFRKTSKQKLPGSLNSLVQQGVVTQKDKILGDEFRM